MRLSKEINVSQFCHFVFCYEVYIGGGRAVRAGGGEGDAVVLVVSTARMARRRNLAVLRGNWGNCVTVF